MRTQDIRRVMKHFLELWYCTVIVGYMATLIYHLQNRALASERSLPQTHAPPILPLLEAPTDGFFWKHPECDRRTQFDVLHGWEACPIEDDFHSREQPKVTLNEVRRLWWSDDDGIALLGEELLHYTRCMARCVIVTQKPMSLPATSSELHRPASA
jgi:hypothetical protein